MEQWYEMDCRWVGWRRGREGKKSETGLFIYSILSSCQTWFSDSRFSSRFSSDLSDPTDSWTCSWRNLLVALKQRAENIFHSIWWYATHRSGSADVDGGSVGLWKTGGEGCEIQYLEMLSTANEKTTTFEGKDEKKWCFEVSCLSCLSSFSGLILVRDSEYENREEKEEKREEKKIYFF